nr:MAG TPA: hypothetical protein [Caudoviricetes sp.]
MVPSFFFAITLIIKISGSIFFIFGLGVAMYQTSLTGIVFLRNHVNNQNIRFYIFHFWFGCCHVSDLLDRLPNRVCAWMLCNYIPQPLIWITYAIGLCNLPSNRRHIAVFICIFFLGRLLKCAYPQALKANFAIRTGFKIVRSHSKFLLNIAKDALVILVCFGFENKVNSLFHTLTSSFSFRCRLAYMKSTRRNNSFQPAATKRTFLSRRRTDQADCWSSSSGSKVRCPSFPPHHNSRTNGQTHVDEQPDKHCLPFFKQVVYRVFDCPFRLNYYRQQD